MFLALQFPFTDVRPFLSVDTGRLPKPSWPHVVPNKDFVRSFGLVKRRLRGGAIEWPGEENYCRASRALRFAKAINTVTYRSGFYQNQFCAFRRFLADGCAVARYEVGLSFRPDGSDLEPSDFIALAKFALTQEVSVFVEDGNRIGCPLLDAPDYLAGHYLRASTKANATNSLEKWWFSAGEPMLLIEHDDWAWEPKHTTKVKSELLKKAGLTLSHMWLVIREKAVGVWLLGHEPYGSSKSTSDVVRRLRMNLFRIHAERESIKTTLRLVAQKKIEIDKQSPATERFESYMFHATNILSRKSYEGLPQSKILKAAYNAEELINAGEHATLLTQLSSLKRNLVNNVKRFIEPGVSEQTAYHISDSLVRICNTKDFCRSGPVSMTDNTVSSGLIDFLIITALEKERGPVSKALQAKPLPKHHEDSIRYEAADVWLSKDERYVVRLICVGDQGPTYTAAVLSNALARYSPRYVVMAGIAAVVPGEKRELGDILVSTDIVDLTDQKQWPDHAEVRKRIFRCDRELVQEADRFYRQSRKWSKSVKMGAIISQTDLVKSAKHRDEMVKLVRETEPALRVVGLEREGAGLGASPEIRPSHLRPSILMVKSAVDFANYFKNDKVQRAAATRSAEFLREFLKSRPVGVRGNVD